MALWLVSQKKSMLIANALHNPLNFVAMHCGREEKKHTHTCQAQNFPKFPYNCEKLENFAFFLFYKFLN